MNALSTLFLGIIAAVLMGAAIVWWMGQPSAAERRAAESDAVFERLEESTDRLEDLDAQRRALGD